MGVSVIKRDSKYFTFICSEFNNFTIVERAWKELLSSQVFRFLAIASVGGDF
jgi:hypothetical protein